MAVTWQTIFNIIFLFGIRINVDARRKLTKDVFNGQAYLDIGGEKVSIAQEEVGMHWPMGVVTYYLDNLYYDSFISQRVRMAMNTLESASCVRFKPILIKPNGTENVTWIHFSNPQGERNCAHQPIYYEDGEILIVLGFDCLKEREILHTLLHAIGFKDEVSHPHRDQYIRILWKNIQPEYRHLYRIQTIDEMSSTLLVEYDPLSIMHFHDRAFSVNGHATVVPLIPGLLISPSKDLSQLDKMKLRLLFDHECNKRKVVDMIDTCKMVLNNNTKIKEESNATDSTDKKNETETKEIINISNNIEPDNEDDGDIAEDKALADNESGEEGESGEDKPLND